MSFDLPPLIATDLETTGLYPEQGARICELCFLRIVEDEIVERFSTFVNPERPIPQEVTDITGISDDMVRSAPLFSEIAPRVVRFLAGREPLLAHNAAFDLSFLNNQFALCGYGQVQNPIVDTLKIARNFFQFESNALGKLLASLNIPFPEKLHRAEGDAISTYRLLKVLMERMGPATSFKSFLLTPDQLERRPGSGQNLPPWLAVALKNRRQVKIRYMPREGIVGEYDIEPREVKIMSDLTYLVALCLESREEKIFRLDRILELVENNSQEVL
jgi:DNA polymerase III epsilon subunit family exonuclease